MTVIAHSQGGLVARRALVAAPPGDQSVGGVPYRLVTISSPFGGIRASADGEDGVVPEKLIAVLREQGILAEPPPEERAAMGSLLLRLYAAH